MNTKKKGRGGGCKTQRSGIVKWVASELMNHLKRREKDARRYRAPSTCGRCLSDSHYLHRRLDATLFSSPSKKKKKNIEQKIKKKDLQEAWKQVTAEHLFSASPSLSQAVSQRAKRLWTCKYFVSVRVWLYKAFSFLFFFGKVAQHCFFCVKRLHPQIQVVLLNVN